ncbi:MAG: helix-turn-helix transcriptional regulator [Atopobiaceae bacterium]|nr:helix-turn-helix transcriptional regulator [Atopobiaceae bacterium]
MARVSTDPKTSLRKAMNLRGMTTARLSELTGIPVSTINLAAGGFQRLRPDRVRAVAEVLHVTPEELKDITGGKNGGTTDFLAKPAKRPELHAPANKEGIVVQPPMSETEKLRLYMHQLERRVRALEAQVKELADD